MKKVGQENDCRHKVRRDARQECVVRVLPALPKMLRSSESVRCRRWCTMDDNESLYSREDGCRLSDGVRHRVKGRGTSAGCVMCGWGKCERFLKMR